MTISKLKKAELQEKVRELLFEVSALRAQNTILTAELAERDGVVEAVDKGDN